MQKNKASAKSYAAGTVINALSTGKGSAFALNLVTKVEASCEPELKENILVSNGKMLNPSILDAILKKPKLSCLGKVYVESESDIPSGSGLGSSSSFMNSILLALFKLAGVELNAVEILKMNAELSLELKISYTGALDDASASMLGGFVVTDNTSKKILRHDQISYAAAILLPEWKRGKVSLEKMRSGDLKEIELAFKHAIEGDYCKAIKLNSRYCCKVIGYPEEPVKIAEKYGLCSGLSGNGPAYVAYGHQSKVIELLEAWNEFGRVILTKIPNTYCDELLTTQKI